MLKGLIFSESLQPKKYLKSCLPKRSLLDNPFLKVPISSIKFYFGFYFGEVCVFQFQCHQISQFFYPFLYMVLYLNL